MTGYFHRAKQAIGRTARVYGLATLVSLGACGLGMIYLNKCAGRNAELTDLASDEIKIQDAVSATKIYGGFQQVFSNFLANNTPQMYNIHFQGKSIPGCFHTSINFKGKSIPVKFGKIVFPEYTNEITYSLRYLTERTLTEVYVNPAEKDNPFLVCMELRNCPYRYNFKKNEKIRNIAIEIAEDIINETIRQQTNNSLGVRVFSPQQPIPSHSSFYPQKPGKIPSIVTKGMIEKDLESFKNY